MTKNKYKYFKTKKEIHAWCEDNTPKYDIPAIEKGNYYNGKYKFRAGYFVNHCAFCGTQRCPGEDEDIKNCPSWTGKPEKSQVVIDKMVKALIKEKPVLTNKDKVDVYSNIATGAYSKTSLTV